MLLMLLASCSFVEGALLLMLLASCVRGHHVVLGMAR